MLKFIHILLAATLITACGPQRKLQKEFTGKPVKELEDTYGKPASIIELGSDSVYVFEKSEKLKPTEISQGRLTLDPIVTPAVVKTERFYFTVKNGRVTTVRKDEAYER